MSVAPSSRPKSSPSSSSSSSYSPSSPPLPPPIPPRTDPSASADPNRPASPVRVLIASSPRSRSLSALLLRPRFFPRAEAKTPSALVPPRLPVKLPVTLPASLVPAKLRSVGSRCVGKDVWRRGCWRCFLPMGCDEADEMEGRFSGLAEDW